MAANQLDQASYTKFFTDINNAMKEKSEKKVTLAMVLARNNVQLNLPPDIMAKIQIRVKSGLNFCHYIWWQIKLNIVTCQNHC